jgi:hypothetical protein
MRSIILGAFAVLASVTILAAAGCPLLYTPGAAGSDNVNSSQNENFNGFDTNGNISVNLNSNDSDNSNLNEPAGDDNGENSNTND